MARIKMGSLGPYLSGTIGKTVHSHWKGIPYIKTLPRTSKSSATSEQVVQRSKFAFVTSALRPLRDVIKTGYRTEAVKMTEFNMAISHCMKNAVSGITPDFHVNYSLVQVSSGSLPNVTAVASAEKGVIRFNWTNNTGLGKAKARDSAVLVAWRELSTTSCYKLEGALRHEEMATLTVPFYSGKTVHTWIFFISSDGKDIAPSMYTGQITVL
jgi:Family of unknown function (DUF6266)